MKFLKRHKVLIACGIVWLFHISGIIGISTGHTDWFLSKTPLNLFICLLLFVLIFPLNTLKKASIFLLFFAMGMIAEWLGVHYGLLFGNYTYGENFGPKLDGIPWLIGCFWALLAFICSAIVSKLPASKWVKISIAATLMVFLDFFMEQNAPAFGFWEFNDHVPIQNYVTWFVLGALMQGVLNIFKIEGNRTISFHLYLAQWIFFAYFTLVSVSLI